MHLFVSCCMPPITLQVLQLLCSDSGFNDMKVNNNNIWNPLVLKVRIEADFRGFSHPDLEAGCLGGSLSQQGVES